MASGFPPVPVFPQAIDSDTTLFLVYNTSESTTTVENEAWSQEIAINPVAADKEEIWAENGFANIEGELFYYDAVEKDSNGKIFKFIRCARNLGGTKTTYNPAGAEVRGFVIAEHHNQLADAIIKTENFVGENFSVDESTLDWRIRNLQQLPTIFDDHNCPNVNLTVIIEEEDPAAGTLISYLVEIEGTFNSYRLDFGDGQFTTTTTEGEHRYAPNAVIDPVVTVSNDTCTLVQTPVERTNPTEPSAGDTTEPFEIRLPTVPDIPELIFPTINVPEDRFNLPPIVFPCLDIGPIGPIEIPSIISVIDDIPSIISITDPNIPSIITVVDTIPSVITVEVDVDLPIDSPLIDGTISVVVGADFPTLISITPLDVPSLISITPVTIPTSITITPVTIPTLITITPVTIPTLITITPVTIPTTITITPVTIPTLITITPVTIPTTITITPVTIPTLITITPVLIPTLITITPVLIPTLITITPVVIPSTITITPVVIPTAITITPVSIPTVIEFGPCPACGPVAFGPAPTISVDWGTPPSCSCVVTVECPSSASSSSLGLQATSFRSRNSFINDSFEDSFNDNDELKVEVEGIGIPSEIRIVPPKIPNIKVHHDIPESINIKAPDIPDIMVRMAGKPIPNEINVINKNVPETISLVADTSIPKVIKLDAANIPTSIFLEPAVEMPTSIKLDTSGLPDKIQVVGIPEHIELIGPSEIQLKMPENPEIEMVYKGSPVEVKLQLDFTTTKDEEGRQCVAIVPCNPK